MPDLANGDLVAGIGCSCSWSCSCCRCCCKLLRVIIVHVACKLTHQQAAVLEGSGICEGPRINAILWDYANGKICARTEAHWAGFGIVLAFVLFCCCCCCCRGNPIVINLFFCLSSQAKQMSCRAGNRQPSKKKKKVIGLMYANSFWLPQIKKKVASGVALKKWVSSSSL